MNNHCCILIKLYRLSAYGALLNPLIILFGKVFYYNSSIANTQIFFIIYTSEMKQYLTQSADYYCSLEC